MPFSRRARRIVSRAAAVMLLTSMVTAGVAVHAPKALAAGTVLFSQPFHDNTVDGTAGSVSLPTAPTGTNAACLSAAGNATANPLASCPTVTDLQGSGKLRLTANVATQEGGIFASTSIPTSQGLDVSFNTYQYGPTQGADGLAFVLAAVNPANPVTPAAIGQPGGALGYSAPSSNSPGLSYGYLGVGFDVFGNFSNHYEGLGCNDAANIAQRMPGQVVVRGPGNGNTGYCALQSSAATATSPALTLRASTRGVSVVPVEVVYNPSSVTVTTPSGLVVPGRDYDVHFTPVGGTARDVVGALPVVPSGLYPASWINASGYPKQLAFGWVASTGSVTDYHEIDNAVVNTLNPVPQLGVAQTSYAGTTLAPGSPVTYSVAASSSGAAENQPVTVTETLPAGILPVGASGTGWVCAAPSGQSISCTNSTSPFTSGTITVNGVVTSSSVTPAVVQSSTSAVASSSDASPATSSSAPAGTLPTAPTVTAISPTNFAAGGGNDVKITGTGLNGATAIEIGTAAQFTAGTPTTLVLCASSGPGCFTVTNSTTLDISAMPGHVAGAVTVQVVTLGTSASTAYTYNSGPALLFPAPPGGEAGVPYSDQLTVTGGTSPFTWSVSAGSLPPGVTLNASTGLLSGTPTTAGTYSFTVKVADTSGQSNTQAVILTVTPGPSLSFPSPPSGWTHTVYGDTLTESGGTSPFAWSVSSGSLPSGISLNASGTLSGTPTATGTFGFTVKVTDASGQSATQATSITVSAGVSATFSAPPAADVGGAYSDTLTASGGTTPYTWSVNAGTLPPGLSLSSAGVLAGTPTTAGSYPFTVNVVDANNGIATASITLVVSSGLVLSFTAPPNTDVGIGYSDTLTATGGTGPNTWSVSAGSLPAGITLNASTGALAGTATTAGTSSFTIKVTDAVGQSATKAATIVVAARPSLAFPAPPSGQASVAYSDTLTVTGGTGPFAWSVPVGSLPSGLTLNASTGVLSGTPASAGSFAFTVQVSDAFAVTATEAVTLVIGTGPLVIAATASSSPAVPGGTVQFTVTVTNTGLSTYTGATFTDSLTDVVDDASNITAAATAGTVGFASPNVTWTGTLAPGAVATITFSVTVNNPDNGNKILASTITSATTGSNCAAGSSDSRCAVSVPVSILAISATPSTTSATPGTTVSYTITVTNTGQSAYTGATFTDPLVDVVDDAGYNGDAKATAGSVSYASSNLTWTGNLAPGASATITFSVTVNNPDTGSKVLASTITTAAAGSNCPAGGTDSRCSVSVPVLIPALTITATANTTTAAPGTVIGYTVTVKDSGQTPYTGATFTDSLTGALDDAAYNGNAAAAGGSVTSSGPNLIWTGDLAAGATATIMFSVTVNSPDTGDKVIVTAITSSTVGSTCPPGGQSPGCTVTVAGLTPALTITQAASPGTATPGSVVQYTVTVTDSGQTPYTGAAFTDPLGGVLDDAAYRSDAYAAAGTVSFASPNLTWTGDLAAGAAVTITFSVKVNSPDNGDHVLASTVTSGTAGSNCAAGSGEAACTATVDVAVLTIVSSSNVSSATPGSVVRFTAVFTNAGQVAYTGITIASNLAAVVGNATPDGDRTATSGTLAQTATGLSWTGNIPVGGSVTVTGTVTVNNPDTGTKLMTVTTTTAAAGSNCPAGWTDPRCSVSVPVLVPGLSISQVANAASPVPGQVIGYTVTITNTGTAPYAGATVTNSFAQMLDDATYDGDASPTAGAVSYAAPVLTWTGDLAPGASAVITYTITVNNPDTGDKLVITTVASAAAGSSCPPGTTTGGCQLVVAVLTPALTIAKTASITNPVPGQTVTYTITVTDTGQTSYAAASLADPLGAVLGDAAYDSAAPATATAGTVSYTGSTVSWTGDLAPAASATITYSVIIDNPDNGDLILANTVTSPTAGSNCAATSTDPRCTVTVTVVNAATLTITAAAGTAPAVAGGKVTYTVTIANSGLSDYPSAAFTVPLSGVLGNAAYDSDAAAVLTGTTTAAGTVSYTSPDLGWTGTVPASGSVTLTYSVTVNSPDTGSKILSTTVTSASTGSNCGATSTDLRCTVTVGVSQLAISGSWSAATTTPGSVIGFTVTLANTGKAPYTGITVATDPSGVFANATSNGDQAATSGTITVTPTGASWTGSIPAGGTVTITGTVTVNNPDNGNKILAVVLSTDAPGSNCPAGGPGPGGPDPACTITALVLVPAVPALSITQTASTADAVPGQPVTAVPGQVITYTVTITNTGQTTYTAAAVTVSFAQMSDDGAYNGDASATAGRLAYAAPAPTLTWTGDLNPGDTAVITYTVTANNPDTGDKLVITTAASAAAGSTCPPGTTTSPCQLVVAVLTPALTITAAAAPATATPGATITYTLTVTDTGQTPYPAASLTDPLAGVLNGAAYNTASATATIGAVTYTDPDLTWTGNLSPGDTATITFSVTVSKPDTGNHLLASTITSATAGSNCPASGTDPRCTTTVPVSDLIIDFTASAPTTTPGAALVYTATFTNNGQTPYYGISVSTGTATLAANVTSDGNVTTSSGTLSIGTAGTIWTGDIPIRGTVTITSPVRVDNPVTTSTLTATAVSTAPGNNCPPGSADPRCTPTTQILIPALSIVTTASTAAAVPGQTLTFTVTVTDNGQTRYTGATVTDTLNLLDDATYNNDAGATSGAVSYAKPVITWTGDLAAGASAVITYTVTVNNPDTGDKDLATVAASTDPGSSCPPASSNAGCSFSVPVLTPALTITKTATVTTTSPGSSVGYTITVADTGQTSYSPATVTDDLAGVLHDAAYNGDAPATATAGTVSYASSVLTWTGNLAPGDTATITYSVTVDNPDTGGKVLSNAAASANPGSTCPAGSTGPPCAVTVPVIAGALTITAPDSSNLGSASVGSNLSGDLGTVQVTDNRGFGAGWTATVSSTGFATGTGTPADTIPVSNASYNITALTQATGPATFTPVPVTQLSTAPRPVVSATNVTGNTTATWNPIITVTVPPSAIVGLYTATITHSVS